MKSVREQIRARHEVVKETNVDFAFSFPLTPDAMHEILNLGEEFNRMYNYTVGNIPGSKTRLIFISLKERR
jgi:hypothetical protein